MDPELWILFVKNLSHLMMTLLMWCVNLTFCSKHNLVNFSPFLSEPAQGFERDFKVTVATSQVIWMKKSQGQPTVNHPAVFRVHKQ